MARSVARPHVALGVVKATFATFNVANVAFATPPGSPPRKRAARPEVKGTFRTSDEGKVPFTALIAAEYRSVKASLRVCGALKEGFTDVSTGR
ncbi:hypothetical protein ACFWMR_39135, partial [Amycolatopsis thailandensis]|uniref:hypothetical protein n=1 Tax=Amycolatopsis thailandensis TaxID=589330 RepID=UPI00364C4100